MTKKLSVGLIIALFSILLIKGQESTFLTVAIESPQAWNNVFNESNSRNIYIDLLPSYNFKLSQKYPVLYLLAGFGTHSIAWTNSEFQNYNIKTSMIN